MGFFVGQLKKKRYKDKGISVLKALVWGRKRWILLQDFTYVAFDKDGNKIYITAPKGMITDGGTIPRFMWWYVSPSNKKFFPAYVIHDIMRKNPIKFEKSFSDVTFYEMLIELQAKEKKALNMFYAVRNWNT